MLVNKKVLSALKAALNIGLVAEHAEAIKLIEAVQPVVQVDDIKLTGAIISVDATLDLDVPGYAEVIGYTCPVGKRAYVLKVGKQVTTVATVVTCTIDGVYTLVTITTVDELSFWTGFDLWLEAGDTMGIRATDNIGDVARHFYAILVEVPW